LDLAKIIEKVDSDRLACIENSASEKVIAAVASKKAEIDLKQNKGLDRNTELVARSSKSRRDKAT
jgi:hypothetical protein